MFVGCIDFKNHIYRCTKVLEPITKLTKKGESFVWGQAQQGAFEKIKDIVLESIMLAYSDMNQPIIPYTASSDTQQGGLLVKTISTFSWKFKLAQLNYRVKDKEIPGTVESLKHFCNIIYSTEILFK